MEFVNYTSEKVVFDVCYDNNWAVFVKKLEMFVYSEISMLKIGGKC